MRTTKDGWKEYAGLIPKEAGAAQRRETEMAFYAGCLHIIGVLIENSELPDEQAMQALDDLMAETRTRFREILDRKHGDERSTQ
jgi:hypothetical protein